MQDGSVSSRKKKQRSPNYGKENSVTPSAAAYKKAVAKRGLAFYKEKMSEINASRQRSKNSFVTNTTVDGYQKQHSQQPSSTDGLPHV